MRAFSITQAVTNFVFFISLITISSGGVAQDRLCYSPESKSNVTGVTDSKIKWDRNFRHELALRTAGLAYKLGDLTTAKTGAELIAKHAEFKALVPPNYSTYHYMANRSNGAKYVILEPNRPDLPFIVSFAGTENGVDAISDLTFGSKQLDEIQGFNFLFLYCNYTASDGQPLSGKNWLITGHSLGGGLAQAFAYYAQKNRLNNGMIPANIELVTFNAFGASDLIEKDGPVVKSVVDNLSASNYFLTDDLVSRIGRHLGPTYEVNAQMLPSGIGNRHTLKNFWPALTRNGQIRFDLAATEKKPSEQKALRFLKQYAHHLAFIGDTHREYGLWRLEDLNVLEEAVIILARRKLSKPFDEEALHYFSNVNMKLHMELRASASVAFTRDLIKQTERIQERILAIRR